MFQEQENIFYYITVMNENYPQPALPKGVEEGIIKGIYLFQKGGRRKKRVQLLGSGTILREVIAAGDLLEKDFGVSADVWSVTSFNELARDGQDVERWNMLHPEETQRVCYLQRTMAEYKGPVIAATDYVRAYPNQIRQFIQGSYKVLGTDGYGRSDLRSQLRRFFEVNRYYVVLAALTALAEGDELDSSVVSDAIRKYRIDTEKPNPMTV